MLADLEASVIVSRWFHFAAFIVVVGGTVFIRFLLHPSMPPAAPAGETAPGLQDALRRRWSRTVHVCIAILILTGTYNAIVQFPRHQAVPGQMPLYHTVFGLKLLLVLTLFFVAIALTGRSQTFEAMRRQRPAWLAFNTALAAVIVLLSNILKNIPPTP